MKVFILNNVLCDYSCGCIIVAAKNKKEAINIILSNQGSSVCENIEEEIEEVVKG